MPLIGNEGGALFSTFSVGKFILEIELLVLV